MDIATSIIVGTFAVLFLADLAWPARKQPRIRGWRLKGLAFFAAFLLIPGVAAYWDGWFAAHRLIDGTALGFVGGTLVGMALLELGTYLWHRALHRVPFLWRHLHQMHHSAERFDISGAVYFHPVDLAAFTFVGSLSLLFFVGLPAEAAVTASVIIGFLNLFQHANVKTPQWLGYLIQRPENHAVHHERGVHAYNYGSLALWDQVFGTWRNPKTFDAEVGFYAGASKRIPEMLIGRDVTEPPARTVDAEAGAPLAEAGPFPVAA